MYTNQMGHVGVVVPLRCVVGDTDIALKDRCAQRMHTHTHLLSRVGFVVAACCAMPDQGPHL